MKSLVLTVGSSTYMTRQFVAPTNQKIGTFATWFKLTSISTTVSRSIFMFSETGGASQGRILLLTTGAIQALDSSTSAATILVVNSTITVNDTTTWHHFTVAYDLTLASSIDRCKIWVDGVRTVDTGTAVYPSTTDNLGILSSGTVAHLIGALNTAGTPGGAGTGNYFDGQLADTYFVDGLALTPASFTTGSGPGTIFEGTLPRTTVFGNNGFWLSYYNSASITTMGQDDAGGAAGSANGANDWTLSALMTTANSGSSFPAPQYVRFETYQDLKYETDVIGY